MIHPNSTSNFATEILGLIINELPSDNDKDKDSLAALASCRLASHLLCSLATPLFFSSIELTDTDATGVLPLSLTLLVERASKLNEILTIYNIAASVHTLALNCTHDQVFQDTTSVSLISATLRRLPCIRNFTMNAYFECDFSTIPEDLASAIQALCSPNLRTLDLFGFQEFPFTAITACPNLRRLVILQVEFDQVHSRNDTSSPQVVLYLDSLETDEEGLRVLGSRMRKDSSFAKRFSRVKDLKVLTYYPSDSTPIILWDVMLLASQTLTTFDLTVNSLKQLLDNVSFDLGRFPALRRFDIYIQQATPADLAHLTQLLSISSSSTGIDILTISITINWYNVREGSGKGLFASEFGWSTLDQLLTSQTFGSLTKFLLCFNLIMRRDFQNLEKRDWDQERMLRCKLAEALTLESVPYVNDAFPLLKAKSTRPVLDVSFTIY